MSAEKSSGQQLGAEVTISILLLTVFLYVCSYTYKFARLRYYEIPTNFLELRLEDVLAGGIYTLFSLMAVALTTHLVRNELKKKESHPFVRYVIFCALFIVPVEFLVAISFNQPLEVLAIIVEVSFFAYFLAIPTLRYRKKGGYILRFQLHQQSIENKFKIFEPLQKRVGKTPFLLTAVGLFSVIVAFLAGGNSSKNQAQYITFWQGGKQYAVVDIFKELSIAVEFDERSMKTSSVVLFPIPELARMPDVRARDVGSLRSFFWSETIYDRQWNKLQQSFREVFESSARGAHVIEMPRE